MSRNQENDERSPMIDVRMEASLDPRLVTPRCPECDKPTKNYKPYCSNHISKMPYVKTLMENYEQEIIYILNLHGSRSAKRLAIDLRLKEPEVLALIKKMAAQGKLKTFLSKRGDLCISCA